MSLTTLILASEISQQDGGGLRAALPLAGRTLLEGQAERAQEAGATRFLILVATLPQELTAAMDRIAARGVEVIPVRSAAEIAAQVRDNDKLLLVADALYAPPACYKAVAEATAPAVLATPDNQAARDLERIDAQTRWAGLALVPQSVVAGLAHISEDWDIGSTLLRQTIQAHARRIMCEPALFERGEIAILTNPVEASLVTTTMLQQAEFGGEGMGQRALFAPLARLIGPALLSKNIPTSAFLGGTVALLAGGLTAAIFGHPLWAAIAGIFASAGFALGGFQQLFTEIRGSAAKLRQVAEWLAYLFPLALVGPAISRWPWKTDTIYLAAIALTLMLLWTVRKALLRFKKEEEMRPDILLPDPEIFFIILAGAALSGFPMMALPIATLLAAGGILAWLVRTAK